MSVLAIALYGSRARGDNDPDSDTDMLMVSNDAAHRHAEHANVSLSFYSPHALIEKARTGDLFLCHIVNEAVVLYDPTDFFGQLRKHFLYKTNYSQEINAAQNLGWFLVYYAATFDNIKLANKRIAWCVRTILIARAAEQTRIIFSASELAEFSGLSQTRTLIANKDSDKFDPLIMQGFVQFLNHYGNRQFLNPPRMEINEYIKNFHETGNSVALSTVRDAWAQESCEGY